jgi:hypothetical protein
MPRLTKVLVDRRQDLEQRASNTPMLASPMLAALSWRACYHGTESQLANQGRFSAASDAYTSWHRRLLM